MGYFREIAIELLPHVRRALLAGHGETSSTSIGRLANECERLLKDRQDSIRLEQQAYDAGKPGGSGEGESSSEDDGIRRASKNERWLTAGDEAAIEFLADALAREPELIPDAIAEVAPDFYPPFLAYLVDVVLEAACPRYPAKTAGAKLWWYTWRWFAAGEYAAQLRERHPIVAGELARTDSWRALEISAPDSSRNRPSGSGRGDEPPPPHSTSTASMLGTGEFGNQARRVQGAAKKWVEAAVEAVGWGAQEQNWQLVVAVIVEGGPHKDRFVGLLKIELLKKPNLVRRLAEASGAAVPFGHAFDVELQEIRASRAFRTEAGDDIGNRYAPRAAADMSLFGLAFSGGGIRSATFNLGILQGLAGNRLLRDVDYVSTVSGGGYIGAWLAAWFKRAEKAASGRGVQAVEDLLRVEPLPRPDDQNVRPLRFLREYSNYLTPVTGFFSADTWTMIAIWLRNTLLNQAVLVMALAAVLALPWVVWFTLTVLDLGATMTSPTGLLAASPWLIVLATVLLAIASWVTGGQLRRFRLPAQARAAESEEMLRQRGVLFAIVLPVIVALSVLNCALFHALPHLASGQFRSRAIMELTVIFVGCLSIVAVRGQYGRCFLAERVGSKLSLATRLRIAVWAFFIVALALSLAGLTAAAVITGVGALLSSVKLADDYPPMSLHWIALGVPMMVAALSLSIVLKVGILGRNLYDDHREWWSRLGAWLNIVSLGWAVLFAIALYAPYIVNAGQTALQKFIVASGGVGWAVWTAIGVLGGSEKTGGMAGLLPRGRLRSGIDALAPYVFIAGLLIIISAATFWTLIGDLPTEHTADVVAQRHWTSFGQRWHWLFAGPGVLGALAFLLSCRVDVNEFSMHHFYKNRLVRCYLGASRDKPGAPFRRSPDPFTGFDSADDLCIADLQLVPGRGDPALRVAKRQRNPRDLEPYVGPVPIVNAALNLVGGDDLAWQERKAQSFAFTPFYSGYDFRTRQAPGPDRFAPYGFRPTLLYGYPPVGIGLGTAVAISGAAASPNMGYRSSPATTFLMTMFNARLGWWMGNPRDKYNWLRSSPRRGLVYLLNELFGLTNDRTHFVNLSDGGHFENLGIYELVRRRCRYIIACDAEQDDAFSFNGLGNAIRKCRIDLGTEISVRATRIRPADDSYSTLHCVVGDIRYPNGESGTLLYLKASITGDEPADVLEYKARQPSFPHHSTMRDQFFDESQFESYRKLGAHVAQVAFAVPNTESATVAQRFAYLRDYWYPAASAVEGVSHGELYEDLLERIRTAPTLAFADAAFFQPVATNRTERQQLFVGASMLDLMQRVFIDLDLENDSDHPHNAGWMMIFRRWVQHDAVVKAWAASEHNYGRRFRRFVNGLRPGP